MYFSGDLILRTHMRMHGAWHLYRPGERWKQPGRDMRIVIATDAFEAVAFRVPVAEFRTAATLERDDVIQSLGPDLLDDNPIWTRRWHAFARSAKCLSATRCSTSVRWPASATSSSPKSVLRRAYRRFGAGGSLDEARVRTVLEIAQQQLRANVPDARVRRADDVDRAAAHHRPRASGAGIVGVWPCGSAVPAMHDADRDGQAGA